MDDNEKKQLNNIFIEKLVELKRRTDYYYNIADKLKKELGTIRDLFFENRDQMHAEVKKNNDLMIELCKMMICEFNNYFLCSEKDRFNTNYYVQRAKEFFKSNAELIEYISKVSDIFASSIFSSGVGVPIYPLWLKMNPLKVDTKLENWFPFCWTDNFSKKNVIAKCFLIQYFGSPPLLYINQFNKCQHQIRHIIDKSLNLQLKSCIFPDGFEEEGIFNIICNYLFI